MTGPAPARWTVTVQPAALRVPAEYLRDVAGGMALFDALDDLELSGPEPDAQRPFPDVPNVVYVRAGTWRALCEVDESARTVTVVTIARRDRHAT